MKILALQLARLGDCFQTWPALRAIQRSNPSLRSLLSHFNPKLGRLELHQPLFQALNSNLADSALNELNRLYSKVKNLKVSNIDLRRGHLS